LSRFPFLGLSRRGCKPAIGGAKTGTQTLSLDRRSRFNSAAFSGIAADAASHGIALLPFRRNDGRISNPARVIGWRRTRRWRLELHTLQRGFMSSRVGGQIIELMQAGGSRGRALFVSTLLDMMSLKDNDTAALLCKSVIPFMPVADQHKMNAFLEELNNAYDPQWHENTS
jgi:hypothetical protein